MTIKEIAKLAQVSSAAVSRYMNGGYVSEEKKERIRAVIEETGYRPSVQARTLRTKRACLVGVIVQDQFRVDQQDYRGNWSGTFRKSLSDASDHHR